MYYRISKNEKKSIFWKKNCPGVGSDLNTLKRELYDTYAYKLQPSLNERVIVDGHGCHTALHFGVKAKENQDKVPTLYWLPKLHKNPYKARFIANSSSCSTTQLSKGPRTVLMKDCP